MSEIGIKYVLFDVDYRNLIGSDIKQIPKHYKKLMLFAEKYCAEKNLQYSIVPYAKERIEEGHSLKNR